MWLPVLQVTVSVRLFPVHEDRRDLALRRHLKVRATGGVADADSLNLDKVEWKLNVIFLLDTPDSMGFEYGGARAPQATRRP
ncbi:MAG: hypothetical protein CVU19_02770 [Betaproteobacteria bacterium HGW-Betaproteobacteria-13]|jgi:hypothetical protein|uniref:Uncharacterized protein n=1 Tax=Parazoarcus communis TaxID=41977 RepID=A0A2U8H4J0_9RHOO|nr:hypothetical protein [Parazoarcus communis]AWI80701.1 hypothetical protein CEW87_15785 [Parazoarcus communis]PKO82247.1 MAG: hypothetical protein CVU19_02770 [Betaproteobacteria bacterium HGW-Betaproteobacteria-13]